MSQVLVWPSWTDSAHLQLYLLKSGDPLTMSYFDNLDNGPLNKYKKS
jgi:hypothetical protein